MIDAISAPSLDPDFPPSRQEAILVAWPPPLDVAFCEGLQRSETADVGMLRPDDAFSIVSSVRK